MTAQASNLLIHIIEDNEEFASVLAARLSVHGFSVLTLKTGKDYDRVIAKAIPNIILLDVQLPDISGLELLRKLQQDYHEIPIIIMTAFGSEKIAVEAIKSGAYDYVKKPVDFDELLLTISRAIQRSELHVENMRLRSRISRESKFRNMLGASPLMQTIFNQITTIVDTDANVFIEGETGTGKDLIAQAIHFEGKRKTGPWVTVNCAAIAENLFESELFGHVKGAFTNAISNKVGKLKLAHGGTVFLDEVTELTLAQQAKLLRVVQDGSFSPVGSAATATINLRYIAATNADIADCLRAGTFRLDLYYRLAVIGIKVPPLRERSADILLLAENFLKGFAEHYQKPITGLHPDVCEAMIRYPWPGNVRELENVIERAVIMTTSGVLDLNDFPLLGKSDATQTKTEVQFKPELSAGGEVVAYKQAKSEFERNYLLYLLTKTNGNMSLAGRKSGINRADLYRLMKKNKLQVAHYRKSNDD